MMAAAAATILGEQLRDGNLTEDSERLRADRAGKRWFAVSTLPHKEECAERHMRMQRFLTFLPRRDQTVRSARRLSTKRSAYFPGYLFVSFDPSRDRWRAVNGTLGVKSLIMQGERPLPVPQGLVERLRDLADDDGLLNFSADLMQGQKVRLLTGPFSDLVGMFDRLDSAGRVRVLISIMNGEIPVTINRRDLAPAA